MESDAGAEKYHRYHEPDPEMHEMGYGGYGTPEKPIYATNCACVNKYFCLLRVKSVRLSLIN